MAWVPLPRDRGENADAGCALRGLVDWLPTHGTSLWMAPPSFVARLPHRGPRTDCGPTRTSINLRGKCWSHQKAKLLLLKRTYRTVNAPEFVA